MNGARAIEPVMSLMASALLARLMKCCWRSRSASSAIAVLGLDRLAEADVGFRDENIHGWQLRHRLGRRGLSDPLARNAAMPPAPIAMVKHDNACGIHTLHFPHYAATLPPP